jgi:hypothetical protein
MNIISTKPLKNGKMRVTVELVPGEQIAAIDPNGFYELGYPLEDIVVGHHIIDAERVRWCVLEQGWVK